MTFESRIWLTLAEGLFTVGPSVSRADLVQSHPIQHTTATRHRFLVACVACLLFAVLAAKSASAVPPTFSVDSIVDQNTYGLAKVAVADMDRDRRDDLVIATYVHIIAPAPAIIYEPRIRVLYQGGAALELPGGDSLSLAVGDINGDGWPDIVTSFPEGIGIQYGQGNRTFGPMIRLPGPPIVVRIADVNGDGRLDVVTTTLIGGGTLRWVWYQQADGTLAASVQIAPEPVSDVAVFADFNLDGILDKARQFGTFQVGVSTGNASGFDPEVIVGQFSNFGLTISGTNPQDIAVGDLNGDGRPDLVVLGYTIGGPGAFDHSYTVRVLYNTTRLPPVVGLATSSSPSVYGRAVTLTTTVTGVRSPTGGVMFNDGATLAAGCQPQVPLLEGVGVCTTQALSAGTHTIQGVYSGDNYNAPGASAPITQLVSRAATATQVASSLNPAPFAQALTLTATIGGGFQPAAPSASTTAPIRLQDAMSSPSFQLTHSARPERWPLASTRSPQSMLGIRII